MANFINKAVWMMANPVSIGLVIILAALFFGRLRRVRIPCLVLAFFWFYFWSTRIATYVIGYPLESDFLVNGRMVAAEMYPQADAIIDFGGGVGAYTNISEYAELAQAADRPYFTAKLFKAGKAPIVIPSSENVVLADAKVLKDFGVDERAIVVENEALNTEENVKKVSLILRSRSTKEDKPSVLLVTSAWHMKRSVLMMKKYSPDVNVIPAPCDFEATAETISFSANWFKPEPMILANNSVYLHEWLGYWGYKLLR